MKEIIYNIDNATAGRVITISDVTDQIGFNNVLGIINKTTKQPLYAPTVGALTSVVLSNGTLTITLADSVTAITAGDKLLVKCYVDADASDAAEQVKDFFGIVKDGDTVKVVTEDGGEEVVEPVGLMDEDDVYDYLEDIAVLMGGITAQQAAAITAATRAIIHGGSGSGSGE